MTTSPENNEMVDAHPTDSELNKTSAGVKPEQVEPDTVDMELVDSEVQGDRFDPQNTSDQAQQQTTSADIAHPMPLGEEVTYSPPHTSEKMLSPPEGIEHLHTVPVVSDHMNPHAVGSEIVHSQPASSEMVHPHVVTVEMVHPLAEDGSLDHSQPNNAELMYSHPESSELVDHNNGHFQHENMQQDNLQPVELVNSHSHGNELINPPAVSMELVNLPQPLSTEHPDSLVPTPDTQPGKRRKKKSIVWEHFTIETVSAGCRRACCKVCKQSFAYSTGSKVAGTSHLKRHIAKGTCPVILRQQEKNQLSPYLPKSGGTETGTVQQPKRRYRTNTSSPYLIFDQDRCRHEIARMIIMHDYPLHMVEHPGFVSFVQNLQPRFDMVSFNIVQGEAPLVNHDATK